MNGVETGQNRLRRALKAARDGHWPDSARLKVYSVFFLLAWAPLLVQVFFEATGSTGSDFLAFWGAAKLADSGHPALVYDLHAQQAAQATSGAGQFFAYVNPPPYLLLIWPLGLLPFAVAWIAWSVVGWALWYAVARRVSPAHAIAIFVSPVAYLAASHAQNGFFTGALLVGGVLALPRRPALAGALFGALVIKPHLALLVPFWLLAGRQWRAIAFAALSAVSLCLLSAAAFGWQTWAAYPESFKVSQVLMSQAAGPFFMRMCTPFAALRMLTSPTLALAGQALVGVAVLALVMAAWRRSRDPQATGALMLAGTALASPYLFAYDLPFLVQPLFWIAAQGRSHGWRPWEKILLIALWFAPFATRAFALPLGINLMPLAAAMLFAMVWTRLSPE